MKNDGATKLARSPYGVDGELQEFAWQNQIVRELRLHGWLVYFIPNSKRAGSNGYPDIHAIHPIHLWSFHAENKRWDGALKPMQVTWLDTLDSIGNACYVWPADKLYGPTPIWNEIDRIAKYGPGGDPLAREHTRWHARIGADIYSYPRARTRAGGSTS